MIQDLISLEGKVALVTGAASGIGRASARVLAAAGARVMLSDVAVDAGQETVEMIRAEGGEAAFQRADVADAGQVQDLVAQTMKRFGRLDCAHNNAGIEGSSDLTDALEERDWDRGIAVNLKGIYLCMRAELPHMLAAGGTIVNTASIGGVAVMPGLLAYGAAKAGVINMSMTVAVEYAARNIRCNALCPGYTITAMTERAIARSPEFAAAMLPPMGRGAQPEEMANAVLFLLSPMSSFLTGQAIIVDGGAMAHA